ncbi:MAG: hypothetical protein KY469_10815 [Actinobacteria bacterium]|nr:hypothetical protein [Actinomycetota bacterium]
MTADRLPLGLRDLRQAETSGDDGTTLTHPTLSKGVVTAVDPLFVDGLPASNITGGVLAVDDTVWKLVDQGRRFIFGIATVPTPWTALPFNAGWSDRGSGWAPGMYRRVGDIVHLRGTVTKSTVPAAGDIIATLPAGFRAPDDLAFLFNTETITLGRLVIRPTGAIEWRAGTASGGSADFVHLNSIFWSVTAAPA